ncbi:MAG: hypothetical protein RRA15_08260 [bacterium]|nr:hypothetical protein [bacterium]MDT8366472.1 hypothetical protein [bacterium]
MKADITSHTLTVRFEDTGADLEMTTKALNDVGYTVGEAEEIKE